MGLIRKTASLISILSLGSGCIGPKTDPQEANSNGSSSSLIIFVTSTDHQGNLGGISGADSICNARASAAGLNGIFVAWISDSSTDAIDRITSNGPWKWVNGPTAFANKTAITNSELIAPYSEFGSILTSDDSWTGTDADGTRNPDNCNNWNSSASSYDGMEGDFGPGVGLWSTKGVSTCDNYRKFICFQL